MNGPMVRETPTSESQGLVPIDCFPLPTMLYDVDTLEFIAVNEATVDHYGYSRDEFAQMTVQEIRPAREVTRSVELIQSLPQGPYPIIPAVHRRRGGTEIRVEIASSSVPMTNRRARVAVIADVTYRSEANARVQAFTALTLGLRAPPTKVATALASSGHATSLHESVAVLSLREREVLVLIAKGLTNQQAGDRLALSVKSVETYRRRIMAKLKLENRAHLVSYALETGLLLAPRRLGI